MVKDLKWNEAITQVLEDEKKALHYADIARLISEKEYRKSVGATPPQTVNSFLNDDIKINKQKSPFVKFDKGVLNTISEVIL